MLNTATVGQKGGKKDRGAYFFERGYDNVREVQRTKDHTCNVRQSPYMRYLRWSLDEHCHHQIGGP
jgi:hypothetical protein